MKKKLTAKEYLFVASMLFGMFFGAGNLIFPVSMGQNAGSHTLWAALGFCVTGVGLPLLGIAAMGVSESRGLFHMCSRVGKGFAYFFTCALYLTIGPLFAIPRTATVSFQIGVAPLVPAQNQGIALGLFSLLFFAVVLFFSLRPSGILTWIGKVLNPLFLLFLGVLIAVSAIRPMGSLAAAEPGGAYVASPFLTGFLDGYNTMDALASLAFGIILIEVIQNLGVRDPKSLMLCTVRSGALSTALMAFIYCALAAIGAGSAAVFGVSAEGGTALYQIATHYFGGAGGAFLGVTITFACIKTSIGLVTSCSTTFSNLFPGLLSYKKCAVAFSLFSFAISNVGLNAIIGFSVPVLSFLYPITIVLIVLCLLGRFFRYKRGVFVGGIALTMLASFVGTAELLPAAISRLLPFSAALAGLNRLLPFSAGGMGWVLPAVCGCGLGLLYREKGESTAK